MNESKPSLWQKIWHEPRRFCFCLLLLSLLSGVIVIIFLQAHPRPVSHPGLVMPVSRPSLGLVIAGLVSVFFFVLAFLGLILVLIPRTRPLMNWILRRRFFV